MAMISLPRLAVAVARRLIGAAYKAASVPVSVFERLLGDSTVRMVDSAQPIFIVGAPRTGSTILYQALTNAFDVTYIDNTACKWNRNLLFGLWLSDRKYGNKPHDNFDADHGNTQRFGGHSPSECGEFWYRWCPRDRHFIDYEDITQSMVAGIGREINRSTRYFGRPFLFKNLNAGQRLRLIAQIFPAARIVYIKRDHVFVLRSILAARAKLGLKEGQWWSVKPKGYRHLMTLPEAEMCARQILDIERQVEEDLSLFPQANVRTIRSCELSPEVIGDLARWLNLWPRPHGALPGFRKDDRASLDAHELRRLQSALSVASNVQGAEQ